MKNVNIYLNFAGNTEEAFNFYKSVFGGEFLNLIRFKDMPEQSGNIPAPDQEKIMHVGLPVGDNVLMATDALESMGQKVIQGNNYYISLHPETREEADRLFAALSKDGKVEMGMAEMPWGSYYGAFRDKFGVQWMIDLPLAQA